MENVFPKIVRCESKVTNSMHCQPGHAQAFEEDCNVCFVDVRIMDIFG